MNESCQKLNENEETVGPLSPKKEERNLLHQENRENIKKQIHSTTDTLIKLGETLLSKLEDENIEDPQELKDACEALRIFFETQDKNEFRSQQNKSLPEKYLKESFIFDDEECVIADYNEWSFQENRQDNFFNMYRHDINNYLAMIEGIVGLFSLNMSSDKVEKYRKILISILKKGELFLKGLTLLVQEPDPSLHIIADLGESKGNVLQEIADEKNVALTFSNSKEQIFTDDAYIEFILRNIIENSLKFVSDDETGRVSIRTYNDSENVFLQIRDNGVGMSEEQRESLAELFMGQDHSVDSTEGTMGEIGTGNGLRGCAKCADLVGIKVEIDSSEMEGHSGTIFTLKIPATENQYNQIKNTESAVKKRKTITHKKIIETISTEQMLAYIGARG